MKARKPIELRKKAGDCAAEGLGPTARPSHSWGRHWRPGHQALPTRCPSRMRARARRACRAGSALSWRLRESPERRWQQCACHPRTAAPAGVPGIRALLMCHCYPQQRTSGPASKHLCCSPCHHLHLSVHMRGALSPLNTMQCTAEVLQVCKTYGRSADLLTGLSRHQLHKHWPEAKMGLGWSGASVSRVWWGWAHLLIELSRREIVVHDGGLEACVGHGAQEAAALVRKGRHMLLDVGALQWRDMLSGALPASSGDQQDIAGAPIYSICDMAPRKL